MACVLSHQSWTVLLMPALVIASINELAVIGDIHPIPGVGSEVEAEITTDQAIDPENMPPTPPIIDTGTPEQLNKTNDSGPLFDQPQDNHDVPPNNSADTPITTKPAATGLVIQPEQNQRPSHMYPT